jgi:hypothetical protein
MDYDRNIGQTLSTAMLSRIDPVERNNTVLRGKQCIELERISPDKDSQKSRKAFVDLFFKEDGCGDNNRIIGLKITGIRLNCSELMIAISTLPSFRTLALDVG